MSASDETCNTPCPGNSSEICGKKGKPGCMSLYSKSYHAFYELFSFQCLYYNVPFICILGGGAFLILKYIYYVFIWRLIRNQNNTDQKPNLKIVESDVRTVWKYQKGYSESAYRKRTDNTMANIKCTKEQTTIYKAYT